MSEQAILALVLDVDSSVIDLANKRIYNRSQQHIHLFSDFVRNQVDAKTAGLLCIRQQAQAAVSEEDDITVDFLDGVMADTTNSRRHQFCSEIRGRRTNQTIDACLAENEQAISQCFQPRDFVGKGNGACSVSNVEIEFIVWSRKQQLIRLGEKQRCNDRD